jgi:hypothetical protein
MSSSREMAQLAFGNPGFLDTLFNVGKRVLKGAVKGIPFIGGIASEFLDPAIDAITSGFGTSDTDNHLDTDGDED